jgi:hypothetical protein
MGENKGATRFSIPRDEVAFQLPAREVAVDEVSTDEEAETQPVKPKRSPAKSARSISAKS